MRGQIDVYGDLYLNMAESLPGKSSDNVLSDISTGNQTTLECAVCLQNCVHPAELPCGHIFCYLCIKGIVNRGRRCAMCRQDIPADYLDKPRLLNPVENDTESQAFTDGHSWFYEGHNGWWQYDVRTSMELETAYQNGERCCEVLVAGFLYVADFDSMLQYRRNDACKRRRIKRDLATTNKKGVAGLKVSKDTTPVNSSNIVSNVLISSMQNLNISNRPGSTTTSRASLPRQPSLIRPVSEQSGRSVHYRRHVMVPVYSNLNEDAQTSETESEVDSEDGLHSRGMVSAQALRNALYVALQRLYLLQIQLSHEYDYFTENAERFQNLQNGNRRSSERRPFGGMSASMSRLNRSLENELDISNRSPARTRLNRSEENVSSLEGNDFEWNGSNSPNPYQTDCFL